MKQNHWLILTVLLLLFGLGGMGALKNLVLVREEEILSAQFSIAQLQHRIVELQQELEPQPYSAPLQYAWISSGCGYRMDPLGGEVEGLHKGVDMTGYPSADVRVALPGIVVEHWPAPDGYWQGHPTFGGLIVVDHGDGLFTLYGHLSATFVHEGIEVAVGQIIGEVGDTGKATGPHLHFEVIIDPLRYLERRIR